MNKITTIIFDFGDVLKQDLSHVFERKYGLTKLSKAKQKRYMETSNRSEKGEIPTQAILALMKKFLAPKLKTKEIENFFLSAKFLPPVKLLPGLKKHYRLAILSNNQKSWPKKFLKKDNLPILNSIPFFNSARMGFRKPHKNIYRITLKKLKVRPQECVFIDDKPENLVPAKELGIKTILYKQNLTELKQNLKKLGI